MPDLTPFPAHVRTYLSALWKNNQAEFWRFYEQLQRSKNTRVQDEENPASISHDKAPPRGGPVVDTRAQKGLLELNPRQRPEWEEFVERSTRQALDLVNLNIPLKGYEVWRSAQHVAGRNLGKVPDTNDFVKAVLKKQGVQLTGMALEVALVLLDLAFWTALKRGYHNSTSEAAFHIPQTLIGVYLWPKKTYHAQRKGVQRALRTLAEKGLLSYFARFGNARKYETDAQGKKIQQGWMYDGTVFKVRLRPGKASPIDRDDLALPDWRDLDADIRNGRTVERLVASRMSRPENTVDRLVSRKELREWALPPSLLSPESLTGRDIATFDTDANARHVKNAVQDVKFALDLTRMQFIGRAAGIISKAMLDEHSRWMYFTLLGGARVLWDKNQDRFAQLQAEIGRVLYEYGSGGIQKPGAVLVTRLKESGLWQELSQAWESCTWKRKEPPGGV